jgi:hypothetical protein
MRKFANKIGAEAAAAVADQDYWASDRKEHATSLAGYFSGRRGLGIGTPWTARCIMHSSLF